MGCDIHRSRIADALRDRLSPDDAVALNAHLETCAECRAELAGLRQLWTDLAGLRAPVPPPSMPGDFERRLRGDVVPVPDRLRRYASIAAALVLGLALGYGLRAATAGNAAGSPAVAAVDERSFLLLLHEPTPPAAPTAAEMAPIVSAYSAWGRALRDEGRLDDGAKLEDRSGYLVTGDGAEPLPVTPGADVVGGYFLIRARDYDDALRTVRDHPHLRRGTIELRAIDDLR